MVSRRITLAQIQALSATQRTERVAELLALAVARQLRGKNTVLTSPGDGAMTRQVDAEQRQKAA